MSQKISKNHILLEVWIDKYEASKIVGLSPHTLKKLRSEKASEVNRLIEGVHFVRYGEYCVRYNAELLRDYAATRSDPEAHHRAIEAYLAYLAQQPTQAGREKAKSPHKCGLKGVLLAF